MVRLRLPDGPRPRGRRRLCGRRHAPSLVRGGGGGLRLARPSGLWQTNYGRLSGSVLSDSQDDRLSVSVSQHLNPLNCCGPVAVAGRPCIPPPARARRGPPPPFSPAPFSFLYNEASLIRDRSMYTVPSFLLAPVSFIIWSTPTRTDQYPLE